MAGIFKASWDRVRHLATFSSDGVTSSDPAAAPRFLPATGVSTAGADAVDYDIRFVNSAGTVVTVGGDQLFALLSYSLGADEPLDIGAGSLGAGKVALGPLTFSLDDAALNPALLSELTSGTAFEEVDVLGYRSSDGALISEANFGLVLGSTMGVSASGTVTFTANFGSISLEHNSAGAGGVLSADPSADWDSLINAPGFDDHDGVPVGPLSVPATLPATGVAAGGSGQQTEFVRFILSNGTTLTFDGAEYFALANLSFAASQSLTIADLASGTITSQAGLGPLTLSFGGSAVNTLLPDLTSGTLFREVDLLTYAQTGVGSPQLVSEASFGVVSASDLTVGTGNALQYTLSYKSTELQEFNSSGTVTAAASWNAITNAADFTVTGSGTATPAKAPTTEVGLGVTGGGTETNVTYYVRFYGSSDSPVVVGGESLFVIGGYSFAANDVSGGKASFGPLTLSLENPALDTTLAALTDGGTTLAEIDVLGYLVKGTDAGDLISDDSFGFVGGTGLSIDSGGAVTYTADYGSLVLQSKSITNAGSLVADPSGTWDVVENNGSFWNGTSTTLVAAPATLPASGVSTQGADAAEYYVRFVETSGTALTIDGAQLFALQGSAFQSDIAAQFESGKLSFGRVQLQPLTLSLGDAALDPALFAQLAAGASFNEIDVLGYRSSDGTLLSDDSFGFVLGETAEIGSTGTLQFTADYASVELQQKSDNSGGTLIADPVASWNVVDNSTGFTSNGSNSTTPLAAPATLPASGVATGTQALDYYVRFISGSGTTLSLDGNQLFALGSFSFDGSNLNSIGAGLTEAGKTSLGPLTLSVTDPALNPTLFGDLTNGTAFGEVDVLGYDPNSGQLVNDDSFGFVDSAALSIDAGGTTQFTGEYGSVELQQIGSGGNATVTGSWNQDSNTADFSTTGTTATLPAAAPTSLPASGVAGIGTVATDYYGRFILANGTTLTVDGDQLFALTGFSAGAADSSPFSTTTPILEPLTLSLAEGALNPTLFGLLANGSGFAEVDVLGYQVSNAVLVSDDSFGLAGGGSLSTDNTGIAQYVVDYGAQEQQYGADGLQADPGPTAATGTLTIAPGQSENVTGLVDSLVTPGLAGDTETITAVTGHATLTAGTIVYDAPATSGPDSFTYTVQDEFGDMATGTVDVTVLCFCAGTRIATPDGQTAVEALRPGDLVRLADGRVAPVRWVGRQTVSRRTADPLRGLPVRIRAGSLGHCLPARDLLVSPGHALLIGQTLVQAGALVNGTSIARVDDVPEQFLYFNVELDMHALLLAEGVAAESFLDGLEALPFDNAAERIVRAAPTEMPYPRVKAARQVPAPVRALLSARVMALTLALSRLPQLDQRLMG